MTKNVSLIICFIILLGCNEQERLNSADKIFFKSAGRLFNENMLNNDSLSKAINLLDSAIYINNREPKYYLTKCQIAIHLKKYDLALNSCDGLLAFDKNNYIATFEKGIVFDLIHNPDSANSNYRTAVQLLDKTSFDNEIFKEYERVILYGLLEDSINFQSNVFKFKREFSEDKNFSTLFQQIIQFNRNDYLTSFGGKAE